MYSRPSASQMRLPAPRSMNGGVPPTARNALTGEFTPPGMTFRDRSNRRSFFELMFAEHRRKLACAALDVGRVEQRADHGDGVGPGVDEAAGVFEGDSPDRDDRAVQPSLRVAVQRNRRPRRARLGSRRESAAEGDVVGAFLA